jgi:hypothetical protein
MKLLGISPKYALGGAGFAAGRTVTAIEPVNKEATLYCHFGDIVKLPRHTSEVRHFLGISV